MSSTMRRFAQLCALLLVACGTHAVKADAPAPAPMPAAAKASGPQIVQLPSLAPLVNKVQDGVVNVEVTSRSGESERDQGPEQSNPFFHFFGQNPFGFHRQQIREGLGSGFIIDPRGYVLTNNHVVEGAISIQVHFRDGRTLPGKVLGRDPATDVALIKLQGKLGHLTVLPLGDSEQMKVGDWVLAIGNPYGLRSSVSLGIISATARYLGGRNYDNFFQTDAAINPGNSGGPLINLRGQVIGMNTAIVSGATGIGFAVPSNLAKNVVEQLEKYGKVTRGYLGVAIQNLSSQLAKALRIPVNHGAVVAQVEPGTPAAKAGLKPEDVIVELNGTPVDSDADLSRRISLTKPGSKVTLKLYREGNEHTVHVTLATHPKSEDNARGAPGQEGSATHRRIGVTLQNVTPSVARSLELPRSYGALIVSVTPGSPAARAELSEGMVVVEANHQKVRTARELSKILRAAEPGSTVLLRVEMPHRDTLILRALTLPQK